MKIKSIGYAFMLIALLTGAFAAIALEPVANFNLIEFFLLSYMIGTAFALALLFLTKKQSVLVSYVREPKKIGMMVLMGLLSYVPFYVVLLYAERYVSAALTAVVFRLSPLLMLLLIPVVLRERLSKNQIVALLLAFLGVYVAITGGQLTVIFNNPNLPIVLLLVAAALSYALGTLLMKRYVFDMSSNILIFNISMLLIFTVAFVATGMTFLPLQLQVLGAMLFIGFDSVFDFYMYFSAFRILKTTFITNVFFLSPFITFVFASVLLSETIQPYYILIAALVAVGLVLQKYDKLGGSYLTRRANRLKNVIIFDVSGAFANTGEVAIGTAIRDGGRVLAMKLGERHRKTVHDIVTGGNHVNVFTDKHEGIANEVGFVRDVLGAGEGDMVVMKAGDPEESERFFEALSSSIENSDVAPREQFPQ